MDIYWCGSHHIHYPDQAPLPCLQSCHPAPTPTFFPPFSPQTTDSTSRLWRKPRDRTKPFTLAMFETLLQEMQLFTNPSGTFISPLHAIFDWTHLGLFTGSRLGKYGQSWQKKGTH
jgi:hypothetical protein